jgi:integrase
MIRRALRRRATARSPRCASRTAAQGSAAEFDFLTFEELSRLLDAVKDEPERRALLLLGSDAGLRQGELVALEWGDVDLVAGTLTVRRSSWHGIVGTPKSGRDRKVPLSSA